MDWIINTRHLKVAPGRIVTFGHALDVIDGNLLSKAVLIDSFHAYSPDVAGDIVSLIDDDTQLGKSDHEWMFGTFDAKGNLV